MDAAEVGGAAVGLCQQHPDQQGSHRQLAGSASDRQPCLHLGGDTGRVEDRFEFGDRRQPRQPPLNNATASVSAAGARVAT
ncbi:MAG: hypothetical protein ACRD0F_02955, partial [Acidimicrobiales bacterium]